MKVFMGNALACCEIRAYRVALAVKTVMLCCMKQFRDETSRLTSHSMSKVAKRHAVMASLGASFAAFDSTCPPQRHPAICQALQQRTARSVLPCLLAFTNSASVSLD